MYTKGRDLNEDKSTPFTVICNDCGSHNVTVTAFEYYDLQIKCNNCGACLSYGSYNENTYREED